MIAASNLIKTTRLRWGAWCHIRIAIMLRSGTRSRISFLKMQFCAGRLISTAEDIKGKKGTVEVDDAFLAEIERWRELLAKNIELRNQLNVRDLNYAVQITIDRIIFLRLCEDRGIEPYGQLQNTVEHDDIYGELCRLFQLADSRYDSGLFHFQG